MFFIFGMPRSGTTLLAQCLNAHSKIVVPHETDFIIPMAFILDRIKDKKIGQELIYKLIINSEHFPGSLGEYTTQEDIYDAVYSSEYNPGCILEAIYTKIAKYSGSDIAGDKSPNDLHYLRMLVKTGGLASSKIKIIHIIRDIRDLMVSVNKTGWVNDLDLYFPRFWSNNNLYLNAIFKDNASNYMLVRYEDFVSKPVEKHKELCGFLGVDFEEEMLIPENRHQRYKGMSAHENLYNPISMNPIGKYRNVLNKSTIADYENQSSEALEKFGYNEKIGFKNIFKKLLK